MAHTAFLKLGNKEYNVIKCEYGFTQPIKENGLTAGLPSGSLILFTLVAPDDSDMSLHEWMQSAEGHKDGQVIFTVQNKTKLSNRTLHFKRAYCIRLYEYFDREDDKQMLTEITISAAEISFGNGKVVFKND